MYHVFLVGIGGCLGSVLRYWLSGVAQRWHEGSFPLGTLLVNVVGCLAVGMIWSLVEYREWFSADQRIFLTVGLLGGFTTFSAFGHETFMMLRDGEYLYAMANVTANVVLGMTAVSTGWIAGKALH